MFDPMHDEQLAATTLYSMTSLDAFAKSIDDELQGLLADSKRPQAPEKLAVLPPVVTLGGCFSGEWTGALWEAGIDCSF